MYIPFIVANVFHICKKIKKLKNVKRVCPKRKIKGKKEQRKDKKMRENEPQEKEKRPWKCESPNATPISLSV